jgi:hypothetical protein
MDVPYCVHVDYGQFAHNSYTETSDPNQGVTQRMTFADYPYFNKMHATIIFGETPK